MKNTDGLIIAESLRKSVSFPKESAELEKPSKLRVPGSIPGAPTTKPLETNGEEQTQPEQLEHGPSAVEGLSGGKLRNNCGEGKIRLIPLASSSKANCCAVVAGGLVLIVDAGISRREAIARLADAGVLTAEKPTPDALLLTHEHGDHARYIQQWVCHPQPIYASPGTANVLGLIGYDTWRKALPWQTLHLDEAREVALTPIQVPHDAAEPLAWRVAYAGEAAVVANDMGDFPHGWDLFVKGAVEMLIEANHLYELLQTCDYAEPLKKRIGGPAGHMEARRAARWVKSSLPATVRRLLVGHLSMKCAHPKIVRHIMSAALGERAVELEVLEA